MAVNKLNQRKNYSSSQIPTKSSGMYTAHITGNHHPSPYLRRFRLPSLSNSPTESYDDLYSPLDDTLLVSESLYFQSFLGRLSSSDSNTTNTNTSRCQDGLDAADDSSQQASKQTLNNGRKNNQDGGEEPFQTRYQIDSSQYEETLKELERLRQSRTRFGSTSEHLSSLASSFTSDTGGSSNSDDFPAAYHHDDDKNHPNIIQTTSKSPNQQPTFHPANPIATCSNNRNFKSQSSDIPSEPPVSSQPLPHRINDTGYKSWTGNHHDLSSDMDIFLKISEETAALERRTEELRAVPNAAKDGSNLLTTNRPKLIQSDYGCK